MTRNLSAPPICSDERRLARRRQMRVVARLDRGDDALEEQREISPRRFREEQHGQHDSGQAAQRLDDRVEPEGLEEARCAPATTQTPGPAGPAKIKRPTAPRSRPAGGERRGRRTGRGRGRKRRTSYPCKAGIPARINRIDPQSPPRYRQNCGARRVVPGSIPAPARRSAELSRRSAEAMAVQVSTARNAVRSQRQSLNTSPCVRIGRERELLEPDLVLDGGHCAIAGALRAPDRAGIHEGGFVLLVFIRN